MNSDGNSQTGTSSSGTSSIEEFTHSFVVKVWLEEESQPRTWRGHITHVPSGERSHFEDLRQLTAFIRRYLKMLGIKFDQPEDSQ